MNRVAIVTDSNSGITQKEAGELDIHVLSMPFYIDGELFYEDINLTQEQFYERLAQDAEISTSQPAVGDVVELWDKLLREYDQVVHIPMSSGLSGSCETAMMLAADYDGKVFVVNNQRISVTQKLSVFDARRMVQNGMDGAQIKKVLEDTRFDSSIYIMVDTMKYLKKGGRVTPAAATLATLLRIKPVLQIQGEKLDAFAKVRTIGAARTTIENALIKDGMERFGAPDEALKGIHVAMAYTGSYESIREWHEAVQKRFPEHEIICDPLSLSVACHIGPGAIAATATKVLEV